MAPKGRFYSDFGYLDAKKKNNSYISNNLTDLWKIRTLLVLSNWWAVTNFFDKDVNISFAFLRRLY